MRSRRHGLVPLLAGVLAFGMAGAAPVTAGPPSSPTMPVGEQQIALHNDTATDYTTGDEACSFAGADTTKSYWHFVLSPNDGTWTFNTIHLVTTGDPDGSDYGYLPNGTQLDNVFVEVPAGLTVTDLVATGSYAWISPPSPTPQRFVLSHTCTGMPAEPEVSVVKTVDTSWERTHLWDIDKELVSGPTAVYAGSVVTGAEFTYRVTQTELSALDAYSVSGTITVSNANDTPATVTSVTDVLPGFDCTVEDLGADPVVVDGSPLELSYTCDPLATLPGGELTNTATATFTYDGGSGSASTGAMPVVFSGTPDVEVDASPVLSDDKYPGVIAGQDYTVYVPASTEACTTGFTNTASLIGDEEVLDSDLVTVRFCVSIGGRTIGFWSNNNGMLALSSGTPTTIWNQVKVTYPNITQSLSTISQLQSFLTARTTNCSSECMTMLRAQFIATALNSLYIPGYGMQAVAVPTSLDTIDGNANGCATVNDLLASIYAQYPFGTTAQRVLAKTTLDGINQNTPSQPFQCTL